MSVYRFLSTRVLKNRARCAHREHPAQNFLKKIQLKISKFGKFTHIMARFVKFTRFQAKFKNILAGLVQLTSFRASFLTKNLAQNRAQTGLP